MQTTEKALEITSPKAALENLQKTISETENQISEFESRLRKLEAIGNYQAVQNEKDCRAFRAVKPLVDFPRVMNRFQTLRDFQMARFSKERYQSDLRLLQDLKVMCPDGFEAVEDDPKFEDVFNALKFPESVQALEDFGEPEIDLEVLKAQYMQNFEKACEQTINIPNMLKIAREIRAEKIAAGEWKGT